MNQPIGLWQLKGFLVIDPRHVTFLARCVFTNEPVKKLTMMKLASVKASKLGATAVDDSESEQGVYGRFAEARVRDSTSVAWRRVGEIA